jgi:hypothetical protein
LGILLDLSILFFSLVFLGDGGRSINVCLLRMAPGNLFSFVAPNCRLGRLQDSNAVLSHFNEYSEHCFSEVSGDFTRNTRLLRSMKSDLDYIFQKLRYV